MAQPLQVRSVIALFLFFGMLSPGVCQKASDWRFWTVADGLVESNTSWITLDGQGAAWAKHGGTSLTRLDGHSVSQVPDPFEGGRLEASPDGDVWLLKGRDLRRHDGAVWHSYRLPEPERTLKPQSRATDTNAFVSFGRGRVLILLRDSAIEFSAHTGGSQTIVRASDRSIGAFLSVHRGANHLWVTGERGAMRLSEVSSPAVSGVEEFVAPAEFHDVAEPREGEDGELLASATVAGKPVIVRLHRGRWELLYTGDRLPLRAWRGSDGDLWIADGNQLMRLLKDGRELVERTEVFAGTVQNALASPGGSFWLTTSQGIARYSPPLWRTDPYLRPKEFDDSVGAACVDSGGTVWFLTPRFLLRFDGAGWKKYPLPKSFSFFAGNNEALKALPDGTLAIASSTPEMFLFHPGAATFESRRHPEGRIIRTFGLRRDGRIFVQTLNPAEREDFRIELFDGKRFSSWLDRGKSWGFWDVRAILEVANGDVWIGAVNGLGVVSAGRYRNLTDRENLAREGAFAMYETSPGHILVGGKKNLREFDGSTWTTLYEKLDRVRSIARSPDGTVWIGSGVGIHRMNHGKWIGNGVEEGLPSAVVTTLLADRQGRIWAGTTRGLSRYHPEADRDPPDTRIDRELNSRTVAPGGAARIVFSGADHWKFTEAGRLLFSWRMDEGPWSGFRAETTAQYSELASGGHRFSVRAMDRNGNVDPEPASFEFHVLAPWYRQGIFLALAVCALLSVTLLARLAWKHHRKLAFDSRHDPLTRLANRRAFEAELQAAIGRAKDDGSCVAVLLLDLDQFKPVNDTLGHAAGDVVLQAVADRLRHCAGRSDILARIGGDEFAIVLPGASRAAAEILADGILREMRKPCRIGDREFRTTASIGISLFPDHGSDVAGLQRLADVAMYHCKARAKDSFRVFEIRMNGSDPGNSRIAGLIRESLERNFFAVHYQPIVDSRGEYFAVEALVRLEHPEAGPIPPLDFIPAAEETGLITSVGQFVLGEACRQLAHWRCAGHSELRVSVNVSPVQLTHPDFVASVMRTLSDAGLQPRALILEITETAMMSRWSDARTQLEQLREAGITVALDDFGTGYSSLSSLHLLPVDYVKIDRSFTQRIGKESRGAALMDGMVQMVHQLGFRVVVEGVETSEQQEALACCGSDFLQGYLLGRPLPAKECTLAMETANALPASEPGRQCFGSPVRCPP